MRFWNTSLPKCLNKDTMFMDICKEKINVFPEGTLFANACTSARIRQRCCYHFGVFLSAVSLNTVFVSADKKVTITKLHLY